MDAEGKIYLISPILSKILNIIATTISQLSVIDTQYTKTKIHLGTLQLTQPIGSMSYIDPLTAHAFTLTPFKAYQAYILYDQIHDGIVYFKINLPTAFENWFSELRVCEPVVNLFRAHSFPILKLKKSPNYLDLTLRNHFSAKYEIPSDHTNISFVIAENNIFTSYLLALKPHYLFLINEADHEASETGLLRSIRVKNRNARTIRATEKQRVHTYGTQDAPSGTTNTAGQPLSVPQSSIDVGHSDTVTAGAQASLDAGPQFTHDESDEQISNVGPPPLQT